MDNAAECPGRGDRQTAEDRSDQRAWLRSMQDAPGPVARVAGAAACRAGFTASMSNQADDFGKRSSQLVRLCVGFET